MFNPDSIGSFVLPAGGFATQAGAVAQRAALAQVLAGPKPTPAQTEQVAEAGSIEAFTAALTELELRLGREALSADQRAVLEADPIRRGEWMAKVEQGRVHREKQAAGLAESTNAAAEAAAIAERSKLLNTGLFAALEAYAQK